MGMLDHTAGIAQPAAPSSSSSTRASSSSAAARRRSTTSSSSSASCASASRRRSGPSRSASRSWAACESSEAAEDVFQIAERARLGPPRHRLRAPARRHGRSLPRAGGVRRDPGPGRRGAPSGRTVPHPLLRHRLREPERDRICPTGRGRCAPTRSARRCGLLARRDRDQRVTRRGEPPGDPGRARRLSARERCSDDPEGAAPGREVDDLLGRVRAVVRPELLLELPLELARLARAPR